MKTRTNLVAPEPSPKYSLIELIRVLPYKTALITNGKVVNLFCNSSKPACMVRVGIADHKESEDVGQVWREQEWSNPAAQVWELFKQEICLRN